MEEQIWEEIVEEIETAELELKYQLEVADLLENY
jgi:hypothetical protein